jgi:hypothetical protein
MAFQPATNIAGIKLQGVVDNQMTINDLYFEITGGSITAVNLSTLVLSCQSWFINELAPLLSEDWSTVQVIGVDLGLSDGPLISSLNSTPGGVTGEAAPNNVAACINLSSANRGRSGHGRNYVPAIPNSVITLNTMSPTFLADVTSAYEILVGAGTFLAGWQLVVLSRETALSQRAVGLGFPVVSVGFKANTVRSMRSRSIGHGA